MKIYRLLYEGTFVSDLAKQIQQYLVTKNIVALAHPASCYNINNKGFPLNKAIIVNEIGSPEFSLIECRDISPIRHAAVIACVQSPYCKIILKCQYQPGYLSNKIVPYSYFERDPVSFQKELDTMRSAPRTKIPLHFRGQVIPKRRPVVNTLIKMRVISDNPAHRKSPSDYIKECVSHKIGLSLPGFGNFCHREIEYFGIGVPTIMPRLINQMHDPLIPDFHYISAGTGTAQEIASVYYSAIQNESLLTEIAHNAMEWYDRNVRFPNSAELACKIMGIV